MAGREICQRILLRKYGHRCFIYREMGKHNEKKEHILA